MCPLALQHSAGLWSRPPSDTSLPCSATTEGIEWAAAAAPPAGHAAEASGTARSSRTTEGSKDRAGEGRIKKVRGVLGVVRHQREWGGQWQEGTSETKTQWADWQEGYEWEKWPHSFLCVPSVTFGSASSGGTACFLTALAHTIKPASEISLLYLDIYSKVLPELQFVQIK